MEEVKTKVIQSGREKLKKLETEGKYVFHGSENQGISVLEPRQAYTVVEGKSIEDDKPAVHASPLSDIAIFMSLVNSKNCPKGFDSGFEYRNGKLVLYASRESLDQLNENSRGFVYVLPNNQFVQRGKVQSIAYDKIEPFEVIEVTKDDLPKDIEIREVKEEK